MKKATLIFIILNVVITLVSCSGGIKGDVAKATINDFFDAVVAEDYDKAEALLHSNRPADLEEFFEHVEESEGLDFQAGIEIEKYTGFSSSFYDSEVGGSRYELTMKTKVGAKSVTFVIEVVGNDSGYGIYNIDLNA